MKHCKLCAFYRKQEEDAMANVTVKLGYCHRWPPNGMEVAGKVWLPATVHENGWCGEFRVKE